MTQGTTTGVPIDTDPTMSANSNLLVPSQAAVVSYVAANCGGAGNKVLLSSQTVSGVSAVNFTSGFGAYSYYYMEGFNILANATTGVSGMLQLSYDGGSSYSSTGDACDVLYSVNATVGTGVTAYLLVIKDASTSTTIPATFTVNLYNIDSNTLEKTMTGSGSNNKDTVGPVNTTFSGVTTAVTTCDALRFRYSDSSNFSGTFRLYGVT